MHAAALRLLSVLAALALPAAALPNGAPRCLINPAFIATKHGNPQAAGGGMALVAASPTYTPGGAAMAIQVTGIKAFTNGGILAYANVTNPAMVPAGSVEMHVGAFVPAGTMRAQTAQSCATAMAANENALSTVTHASPMKSTDLMTLMWTPPATDVGPVQMNVVIATGTVGQPWAVLAPIMLTPAAAGGQQQHHHHDGGRAQDLLVVFLFVVLKLVVVVVVVVVEQLGNKDDDNDCHRNLLDHGDSHHYDGHVVIVVLFLVLLVVVGDKDDKDQEDREDERPGGGAGSDQGQSGGRGGRYQSQLQGLRK
ncbi:hypothetical protein DFJ73DRAFT_963844 [Zopfochytrium polystomum]|nr:hypothetical protein DFJ73DRAFT_963844 [Zopfochytrium polystomum]